MSGGVDSSMAALLLRREGHDLVALTMKIWDNSLKFEGSLKSGCFGPGEAEDLVSAASVAERLGIEHVVIDLSKDYRDEILSYYVDEYLAGKTPNPCVRCNSRMKFGKLLDKARETGLKFDLFATGHYARIERSHSGSLRLLKGLDPGKDQSYFLAQLDRKRLPGLIFPLGSFLKKDIVKIAREAGFDDLASKRESQDFLESDDHSPLFAGKESPPGEIVDQAGNVLGRHKGLVNYTVGQRIGDGIATGKKIYVKKICKSSNTIFAGEREELFGKSCRVWDMNWIAEGPPSDGSECEAKLRYRQNAAKATIRYSSANSIELLFDEPQFAITPGQVAAIYSGDELLGGGIILT